MKQTLLDIDSNKYTTEQLVSILELIVYKIDINTYSGMARSENKTPRGIKISNKYRKVKIGDQLMCVKGLYNNNMPF